MSKKRKIGICIFGALAAIFVALIFVVNFTDVSAAIIEAFAGEPDAKDAQTLTMCCTGVFLALSLIGVAGVLSMIFAGKKSSHVYLSPKNITMLAVFTAISYILYLVVKFPLPMLFPSFLDIQISDLPALLAGFMMGPTSGVIVTVLKILLKLPFTTTACVGELADLVLGIMFVLPSSLIYRFHRTKKGALIGLLVGSVSCTVSALIVNRVMLIPFYCNMFGGWEPILNMVSTLYKGVTQETFYNYYLWLAVLPFNILRCGITVVVTFLVYKQLGRFFNKLFPYPSRKPAEKEKGDSADENSPIPDSEKPADNAAA